MRPLAALILTLAAIAPAGAQNRATANDMLKSCKAIDEGRTLKGMEAFNGGLCLGEVGALRSTASLLPDHVKACPPQGVNYGQAVKVVVTYLDKNPQRLHEDFQMLALEAMRIAWPCKTP